MSRQRKKITFIGGTSTGKSTLIDTMISARVKQTGEPWAIFDPSRQARWIEKAAEIDLDLFRSMKKGTYRIRAEWPEFFETLFKHFKGGQVLCEDASHYLPEKKDDDIYSNLIALRHPDHDIDITFTTHTIAETPLFLLRNVNEVILKKTNDNWKMIKDRIATHKQEEFKTAFDEVNTDPDPYAWRRVILLKAGEK